MAEIKISEITPEEYFPDVPVYMEERTDLCAGCLPVQVAVVFGQKNLPDNRGSLHGHCVLRSQQNKTVGQITLKVYDQFGKSKGVTQVEGDCQVFTPEDIISDSLHVK